jgi:hypothetical protein
MPGPATAMKEHIVTVTGESCYKAIHEYLEYRQHHAKSDDGEDNYRRIKARSALKTLIRHCPNFKEEVNLVVTADV